MIGTKRHLRIQVNIVVDDDRNCSDIACLALLELTVMRDFAHGSYDSGTAWQMEIGERKTPVTVTSYFTNWYWPPIWLWAKLNIWLGGWKK